MHVDVQLRWSDMDAQRHVNNARIADYLQEARVQLLQSSGLLEQGVVVTGQQVQYRRSVDVADEPLAVELVVTDLGAARIEVGYVLRQRGEIMVEARTQLAAFCFEQQRPVRLTAAVREDLERLREPWDPFPALDAPAVDRRGIRTLHHTRWSDLDRYGHVNNVLAFEYLQQARIEVAPKWGPAFARTGSEGADHLWLVARQDVDYLTQIAYSAQPLEAYTAPVRLGRTSVTSAAEVHAPDGTLLLRGRTIVVCAGPDFRPRALPDRERLEQFLLD